MKRALAALLGATALLSLVSPGATAATKPHIVAPFDDTPTAAPDANCGAPSSTAVPDGQPIVVQIAPGPAFTVGQIPASWWRTPPYGDAGWQLQLRGFMWVNALAMRAAQDGQLQSLATIVEQVLAFDQQDPDPGTSTSTTTAHANAWGWDEGTALRRLNAQACLYSLTRDPRLIPGMQADVSVQYGPRFYGPPLYMAHNHGVMADLAVISAADLLGRADWQTRSMDRLQSSASQVWTPGGVTREQSSSYHLFNVSLWGQVADVIEAHRGDSAAVRQIRDLDGRANRVIPWLTEPDRRIVVIGDSLADPGQTRSTWTARSFRDDVAGLVIGRWSWTDPATTYYTVRYGPRRIAHGQQERPGVTWTTLGARILVNPGKAPFDPAGNYRAWESSPTSHNVATADSRTLRDGTVAMTAATLAASWHSYTTTDTLYGVKHTRKITIARGPRWLTVQDTYAAGAAFHQWWHLDPGWALSSRSGDGKRVVFTRNTRTLVVTTTGTTALAHGATRPVGGWNFPSAGARVPAWQISVAGKGAVSTTFTPS